MTTTQSLQITYFSQRYNNFVLELQLLPQDQNLKVKIFNFRDLQYFEQIIDDNYIENHKNLNGFSFKPIDLMRYISNNFKGIKILNGELKFIINFIKNQQIILRIQQKQIDKYQILVLKMEKMNKDYHQTFSEKDQVISQLHEKNRLLQAEIDKIKSQDLVYMKKQIENFKKIQDPIKAINNPYNPHQRQFNCYVKENSIIVKHAPFNSTSAWYNFIMNYQIIPGTRKKYKTKILALASSTSYLALGFGTKNSFGQNHSHNQVISYRCDGYIYSKGSATSNGIASSAGHEVECEIDLIQNKASWWRIGSIITTINLPQNLINKSLYFMLSLYYFTDQVQILLD